MKNTFKILDTGNFYFPLMQRGMKFKVLDTIDIEVKDKKIIEAHKIMNKINKKHGRIVHMDASLWWDVIMKEGLDKEYKDCWIVPLFYDYFFNIITLHMDILKQVKKEKKK